MATQILAFTCDYCGKVFKTKLIAERHEKACLNNPQSHNCLKCTHEHFGECNMSHKQCSKAVSGNCCDFELRSDYPF